MVELDLDEEREDEKVDDGNDCCSKEVGNK